MKRGWLGDKAGQGFYKKSRGADGKEHRSVLDLKTLGVPGIGQAESARAGDGEECGDGAGEAAAAAGERSGEGQGGEIFMAVSERRCGTLRRIALAKRRADAPSIDRAMRAGFNWELGPFEMWDAAGVRETVARMKALGLAGEPGG